MRNNLLALGGAVIGGAIGYLLFFWIADQGFYGLAIPGCLVGLGASAVKTRSIGVAIVCGVLATGLGIFSEWQFAPFKADHSLGYFLTHLGDLKPITLIMIVLGGALGFWIPFRRRGGSSGAAGPSKSA